MSITYIRICIDFLLYFCYNDAGYFRRFTPRHFIAEDTDTSAERGAIF